MRLAAALVVFAAGITAVGTSHDTPTTPTVTASAAAPLTDYRPPRVTRSYHRHPLRRRPHVRRYRLNWPALAYCEATSNPRAVSPDGRYFGAYQFDIGRWRSVGGRGNPADAPLSEQTYRAQLLYAQRGDAPWPVCGWHLGAAA